MKEQLFREIFGGPEKGRLFIKSSARCSASFGPLLRSTLRKMSMALVWVNLHQHHVPKCYLRRGFCFLSVTLAMVEELLFFFPDGLQWRFVPKFRSFGVMAARFVSSTSGRAAGLAGFLSPSEPWPVVCFSCGAAVVLRCLSVGLPREIFAFCALFCCS